jgi:hypothetical protein
MLLRNIISDYRTTWCVNTGDRYRNLSVQEGLPTGTSKYDIVLIMTCQVPRNIGIEISYYIEYKMHILHISFSR